MPARNSAGSRNRSDRNMCLKLRRGGDAPFGADLEAAARLGRDRRRVAELAPQLPDVDVDRPRVAGEGVAPDPLEQLVARQDEALVVEQLPEEVELLRRQLDLLLADLHLAPAGVDHE